MWNGKRGVASEQDARKHDLSNSNRIVSGQDRQANWETGYDTRHHLLVLDFV